MERIIIGLLFLVLGFFVALKSNAFVGMFGSIGWAEEHLGGSRTGYVLIGIASMLFGLMLMTGQLGGVLSSIFRSS